MIDSLTLMNFKGFEHADVPLGPFTVVVGTNASGKSNLRDAFRFLHGISRGYALPEIIGEKYGEGGVLQWSGIRGGTREAALAGASTFTIGACALFPSDAQPQRAADYEIEVEVGDRDAVAKVVRERLKLSGRGTRPYEFDSHPAETAIPQVADPLHIAAKVRTESRGVNPTYQFLSSRPVLTQLGHHQHTRRLKGVNESAGCLLAAFQNMRFLDLAPEAMRRPSLPGQTVLGDHGDHLPSVLQALCTEPHLKEALLSWLRELTPMDAVDVEFPKDPNGRLYLELCERHGQRTSAASASDGTLRFLAMVAAFLGSDPGAFFFLEELENGIHPTRLRLLIELIEQQTRVRGIQVVASTHSPELLGQLSPRSVEDALLTYRLPASDAAKVVRVLDVPDAERLIAEQRVSRLHESGWLEDAMWLTAGGDDA